MDQKIIRNVFISSSLIQSPFHSPYQSSQSASYQSWFVKVRLVKFLMFDRNLYLGGPNLKLLYSSERLQNVTAVTDAPNRFLARHPTSMGRVADERLQTIPSNTGR